MTNVMSFHEIVKIIKEGFLQKKEIEIYYAQTENSKEGWRKIKPESITTDIPPEGEKLVINKDRLSPGHILNAYDIKNGEVFLQNGIKSFIIGKIKKARG